MLDRIFISSDIEGTCGICHWDETELGKADYEPFRRQMTAEVRAACEGAFAGGCDDILIKDAHDSARNLLPAELPQGVQIFLSGFLRRIRVAQRRKQQIDRRQRRAHLVRDVRHRLGKLHLLLPELVCLLAQAHGHLA